MPRPPVKKTQKLAKAKRLGELRAEREFAKSLTLTDSLREHISHMIDKIDPLELAAVGGMTWLVHDTILTNEGLLNSLNVLIGAFSTVATHPWEVWLTGIMNYLGLGWWAPLRMDQPPGVIPAEVMATLSKNQIVSWVVSLTIAFIIVRHAGGIITALGSGLGSLTGLIALLMPAAVG
jgi:hypothetical protein